MTDYEIHVTAPAEYKQRLRAGLRTPLILTAIFAIMALGFRGLMKEHPVVRALVPVFDLVLFAIAVFLQYRWAEKEETWFITHLKMQDDEVEISFTKKDEEITVRDKAAEFIFEKRTTMGRTGSTYQSSYLNVWYKRRLLARQYVNGDWTDMKFIELIYAFEH